MCSQGVPLQQCIGRKQAAVCVGGASAVQAAESRRSCPNLLVSLTGLAGAAGARILCRGLGQQHTCGSSLLDLCLHTSQGGDAGAQRGPASGGDTRQAGAAGAGAAARRAGAALGGASGRQGHQLPLEESQGRSPRFRRFEEGRGAGALQGHTQKLLAIGACSGAGLRAAAVVKEV